MSDRHPTHVDADGAARMVDVTGKDETTRRAVAEGAIRLSREALNAYEAASGPKGEVASVARLAGIQAGKRTAELIPLCHALPGASVTVDLEVDAELPGIRVRAEARYRGRTGVEMEALTAASVSLLTVYDMLKAIDREMEILTVRLIEKEGGASGSWRREDPPEPSAG